MFVIPVLTQYKVGFMQEKNSKTKKNLPNPTLFFPQEKLSQNVGVIPIITTNQVLSTV